MNPALIAAIIKRYGVQSLGGKYELFMTSSQINSITEGSQIQEVGDPVRGGVVLMLVEKPKVVDITPTSAKSHPRRVPTA
jgi:hypothetical protein